MNNSGGTITISGGSDQLVDSVHYVSADEDECLTTGSPSRFTAIFQSLSMIMISPTNSEIALVRCTRPGSITEGSNDTPKSGMDGAYRDIGVSAGLSESVKSHTGQIIPGLVGCWAFQALHC